MNYRFIYNILAIKLLCLIVSCDNNKSNGSIVTNSTDVKTIQVPEGGDSKNEERPDEHYKKNKDYGLTPEAKKGNNTDANNGVPFQHGSTIIDEPKKENEEHLNLTNTTPNKIPKNLLALIIQFQKMI